MSLHRAIVLALLVAVVSAVEVPFTAPIVRTVPLVHGDGGALTLCARVIVPDGAPGDLGVAAWRDDGRGGWTTSPPIALAPGERVLRCALGGSGPCALGLQFWSATGGRAALRVVDVAVEPEPRDVDHRLADVAWDGIGRAPTALVDEAWTARVAPVVGDGFALRAEVVAPDGERWTAHGVRDGRGWRVRVHPRSPGAHQVALIASWRGDDAVTIPVDLAAATRGAPAATRPVALRAPLATRVTATVEDASPALDVVAEVVVADDAPEDLSATAFARAGTRGWRQSARSIALAPGRHRLRLRVPAASAAHGPGEAGIELWSARPAACALRVASFTVAPATTAPSRPRLVDVRCARAIAPAAAWTFAARATPPIARDPALELSDAAGATWRVPLSARHDGVLIGVAHPTVAGACSARVVDGGGSRFLLPAIVVDGAPAIAAGARPVAVRGPLATLVPLDLPAPRVGETLIATVVVGDGAPAELGVGGYARDHDGRWWQCRADAPLTPGANRVRLRFAPGRVEPVGHAAAWNAAEAAVARRGGLFLWSPRRVDVTVGDVAVEPAEPPRAQPRLVVLACGERARTGERWALEAAPSPFPENPYDPDEFALDATIREPDGTERAIPGFHLQPMRRSDRGDHEIVTAAGGGRFCVRFRPRVPGEHHVRLRARWAGGGEVAWETTLRVDGEPWDGYVRVDAQDPRFFAIAGKCWWPVGPNLRSVWDLRSQQYLQTAVTADRGTFAYDAYLARFAAAGADACEIWMSSWNLALEWRGDWTGFHGVGRYAERNAWRLDHVLDAALARGVRVNLVINNHGQASLNCDPEWPNSPYNRACGGFLDQPQQVFTDEHAAAMQERLRRYIVARYADHPAILGWKLWTEMNLTAGGGALTPWHQHAFARWRALDPYGHPVTSHWCGDFHVVDRGIAALPDMRYVCMDAYHGPDRLLAELLRESGDPQAGLGGLGKPLLVTEYGGDWSACPDPRMRIEHATGPWAALVGGLAGAPMLWWFEWIDQRGGAAPYGAIRAFVAGEDLRGREAHSLKLSAGTAGAPDAAARWWAYAWAKPDRVLGYVIDRTWSSQGGEGAPARCAVRVPGDWPAGRWHVEWWDCDAGTVIARADLGHAGGLIALAAPSFRRHVAFKLVRSR